jgi:hypothetical protein
MKCGEICANAAVIMQVPDFLYVEKDKKLPSMVARETKR